MFKLFMIVIIMYIMLRMAFRLMYPRPPKNRQHQVPDQFIDQTAQHPDFSGKQNLGAFESDALTKSATSIKDNAETLEACMVCGRYVPADQAVRKGAHTFCCAEHLLVYEKNNPNLPN